MKAVEKLTSVEAEKELDRLAKENAKDDRKYHGEDQPLISNADKDDVRRRHTKSRRRTPRGQTNRQRGTNQRHMRARGSPRSPNRQPRRP